MKRTLHYPLALVVLGVAVLAISPAFAQRVDVQRKPAIMAAPAASATVTATLAAAAPTVQRCQGPQRSVAPNETFVLTCNVTSPLGGSQVLIVPEMWVPGNGCIVTVDKPRVVMVGNNMGVTATFTNRCGGGSMGTDGGLAWLIYQIQ